MGGWGWLVGNWVNILQAIGIVGGLLLTALASLREGTSLRLNAVLKLSEHHRTLWTEIHRRPELARVLNPNLDLGAHPATVAEESFLNLALVHFQVGWEMAVRHGLVSPEAYRRDLLEFLRLPLPWWVWERTRDFRDPRFVRYVEGCLAAERSQRERRSTGGASFFSDARIL